MSELRRIIGELTDDERYVIEECTVPVVPCKDHGRIDRHLVEHPDLYSSHPMETWCPGAGNGDTPTPVENTGLPPVSECPYCAQCRPMGMVGCLGHYPLGAGNGDDDNTPIGTVTATDGYSPLAHGPMKWCALTVEEHLPMMARYRLIRIDEGAGNGDNE